MLRCAKNSRRVFTKRKIHRGYFGSVYLLPERLCPTLPPQLRPTALQFRLLIGAGMSTRLRHPSLSRLLRHSRVLQPSQPSQSCFMCGGESLSMGMILCVTHGCFSLHAETSFQPGGSILPQHFWVVVELSKANNEVFKSGILDRRFGKAVHLWIIPSNLAQVSATPIPLWIW